MATSLVHREPPPCPFEAVRTPFAAVNYFYGDESRWVELVRERRSQHDASVAECEAAGWRLGDTTYVEVGSRSASRTGDWRTEVLSKP